MFLFLEFQLAFKKQFSILILLLIGKCFFTQRFWALHQFLLCNTDLTRTKPKAFHLNKRVSVFVIAMFAILELVNNFVSFLLCSSNCLNKLFHWIPFDLTSLSEAKHFAPKETGSLNVYWGRWFVSYRLTSHQNRQIYTLFASISFFSWGFILLCKQIGFQIHFSVRRRDVVWKIILVRGSLFIIGR